MLNPAFTSLGAFSPTGLLPGGAGQTFQMMPQGFGMDPFSMNAGLPSFGLPQAPPQSGLNSQSMFSMLALVLLLRSKRTPTATQPTVTTKEPTPTVANKPTPKVTVADDPNDKTVIDKNNLNLSQAATNAIVANPSGARDIIEQEVIKALGTNKPNEVIQKVLGVDIKTGFSEERKTIQAFQLYQDLLDSMTQNTLKALQLDGTQQLGPANTLIDRGGVVLSQNVRDAILGDQADADSILKNALTDATGTGDMVQMMAKIVGVDKLDAGDMNVDFADELYKSVQDDLLKRILG